MVHSAFGEITPSGCSLRFGPAIARVIVCVGVIAVASHSGAGVAAARGSYASDFDEPASCSFSLSPPQTTSLGSRTGVFTATLTPLRCSGDVQPARSTVCLKPSGGNGSCSTAYAWTSAQVFYVPSPAGVTVTATGQGCWNGFRPQDWGCTPIGPVS